MTNVAATHGNFLEATPGDYAQVSHIMLDPSCSTSGASAAPHTDPSALAELAANQLAVIQHAMRFGGCRCIVYSTCSIHMQENEQVVADVLRWASETRPCGRSWELRVALPKWPRRGIAGGTAGLGSDDAAKLLRTDQHEDGTIGFFLAKFVVVNDTSAAEADGGDGDGGAASRKRKRSNSSSSSSSSSSKHTAGPCATLSPDGLA